MEFRERGDYILLSSATCQDWLAKLMEAGDSEAMQESLKLAISILQEKIRRLTPKKANTLTLERIPDKYNSVKKKIDSDSRCITSFASSQI